MTTLLFFMIPISVLLSLFFLIAFFWANKNGDFEDLESPAHRMLMDSDSFFNNSRTKKHTQNKEPHNE